MKKLLAFLALTLAPAFALQVTTTENLNLRSGPTKTAPVLSQVPKGTQLEIGACSQFCPVVYQGRRGYVARAYLKATPAPALPQVTIPARPANPGTYTNVDGQQIQRPTFSETRPAGASAQCRDGSYSFSANRRGTCSHHGGVATWY
ncbi:DUF3761 domain-containing protein [Deinococcus gobiensis]|uniref:Putative lipoprotein n=1 Tax=Deinococcus gobiensis (strain DSM 21396 / JCM 16679 / CGMCC 1.7299 / I-0) TaxID=745776 RepID=H8H2C2_DEIGI|nr:DUF3761 domain-containing protein [Deinococcus gobiensis]AFD27669.1 Putative lipoprotein [Deinococcus gobiensis I-0]